MSCASNSNNFGIIFILKYQPTWRQLTADRCCVPRAKTFEYTKNMIKNKA